MLTYNGGFVIVSLKQDTITSLIGSLNNGTENCVLTYEGDISNCLGINIKKNSYGAFELSQSHLVDKRINHVVLTVSASLKSRYTPNGKPFLYKDKYRRKCVCNYRVLVGMLSYIQGSKKP